MNNEHEPFQGEALKPYKVPPPTTCWWCGGGDLTREHKFKKSDLLRMYDQSGLVWGDGAYLRTVQSIRKSGTVRFTASLCAKCNNEHSQTFDYAYEKFSNYVWQNLDAIAHNEFLDMAVIYGACWQDKALDLARYFAKHIACRMAHDGYMVPATVVPFLNGGAVLLNVQMVLFINHRLYEIHKRGLEGGYEGRGLFIEPAQGLISLSRQRLTLYSSSIVTGAIGVWYRWDEDTSETYPFYFYQQARLYDRRELPER